MIPETITLKGTYAKKIKELCSDTEIRPKLFSTYYRAYMFCAVYGLLNNKTATYNANEDPIGDEDLAQIRSEVIIQQKGKDAYLTIRRVIILSERVRGLPFEDRVDYAMRFDIIPDDDSDEFMKQNSKYNANTELIHSFALGGLNLFYEKISTLQKTPEDLIYFMLDFKNEFEESINNSQRINF